MLQNARKILAKAVGWRQVAHFAPCRRQANLLRSDLGRRLYARDAPGSSPLLRSVAEKLSRRR